MNNLAEGESSELVTKRLVNQYLLHLASVQGSALREYVAEVPWAMPMGLYFLGDLFSLSRCGSILLSPIPVRKPNLGKLQTSFKIIRNFEGDLRTASKI